MKVLITSATRNVGLAIIRGLAENRNEVIAVDDRVLPLGLRSRYAKKNYICPRNEKDGFVDIVIGFIKKERADVILPLGGINLISKHKKKIEEICHCLVPSYKSFMIAFDSRKTLEECEKLHIPCPRTIEYDEAIDILSGNHKGKVVLKPNSEIGGGIGVYIVQDVDTLKAAKQEVERSYGKSVIQEYIPGDTEAMRTVNLVFDKQSRLAAYFTTKKIRQWPNTGGISALSISTNELELVEMVMPLFKKWRWEGPAEVEFKVDPRDNLPKLIEINPRFWGYVGFPIRCGVNFPEIACNLAMGGNAQDWAYPKYPVGVKYINPPAFVKAAWNDFRLAKNKPESLRKILSDLRGRKVMNNIQLTDPLAIIGKVLAELKSSKTSPYWIVPDN